MHRRGEKPLLIPVIASTWERKGRRLPTSCRFLLHNISNISLAQSHDSISDLSVPVLKGNLHNTFQRPAWELKFLTFLDTKNPELNRDAGFMTYDKHL